MEEKHHDVVRSVLTAHFREETAVEFFSQFSQLPMHKKEGFVGASSEHLKLTGSHAAHDGMTDVPADSKALCRSDDVTSEVGEDASDDLSDVKTEELETVPGGDEFRGASTAKFDNFVSDDEAGEFEVPQFSARRRTLLDEAADGEPATDAREEERRKTTSTSDSDLDLPGIMSPSLVVAPMIRPDEESATEPVTVDPAFDYDAPGKSRRPKNPYEVA